MKAAIHPKIEDIYELSPLQTGMLLQCLLDPQSRVHFQQFSVRVESIDPELTHSAWQTVVDRHSILRTSFHWKELGKPLQVVHRQARLDFEQLDWTDAAAEEQMARLNEFLTRDRQRGFDLTQAPLMRVALVRLSAVSWQHVWTFHHLLLDGWSSQVVLRELAEIYEAFAAGVAPKLHPAETYGRYLDWLRRQDLERARLFWTSNLQDARVPTRLPRERRTPANSLRNSGAADYDRHEAHIPESWAIELATAARSCRVTVYALLQCGWALLLARHGGSDDVVFGSIVSGRPPDLPSVEAIVGLFINVLPVRVRVPVSCTVRQVIQSIHRNQNEMHRYEYTPLVEIRKWLAVQHGATLFESVLAFENFPTVAASALREARHDGATSFVQTNVPLTIFISPLPALTIRFLFDRERFETGQVALLGAEYRDILTSLVRNLDRPIGDLQPPAAPPCASDNPREYDWDVSIVQLLEERVAHTPDAPAFIADGVEISYADLNSRANRLANHLLARGVETQTLIGIHLERSIEAVVCIIAVFKASCAYLPLDPNYPQQRLQAMVCDSRATLLLTTDSSAGSLFDCGVINLRDESVAIQGRSAENPARVTACDQFAYVIFTSGSTGKPKGIAVDHRQILNRLHWMWEEYPFAASEVGCHKTSLNFVDSIWEVFGALLVGLPTVIFRDAVVKNLRLLLTHLAATRVTRLWLVPSLLHAMLTECGDLQAALPMLRFWVTSGEALTPEIAQRFLLSAPHATLYNLYGTSEIWDATWHDPGSKPTVQDLLPIGLPIANVTVRVLDDLQRPVPAGTPGELYIGGAGLARGYISDSELTDRKFPLVSFGSTTERLYRTGDRVCQRSDGVLEYRGRIDGQIKLRGHRIEPAEIEAELEAHAAVSRAAVTAIETAGGPTLGAFVIPTKGSPLDIGELRTGLRSRLPEHMVPTTIRVVSALPLTPSGKLDRRSLQALCVEPNEERVECKARRMTQTETIISRSWSELLGVRAINSDSNFFDLGGHSLLAMQVAARIFRDLHVDLPLRTLFDAPSLGQFAAAVDELRGTREVAS